VIAPHRLNVARLAELVTSLAREPSKWQSNIRFGTANRWWTRLAGDDASDIWLLTWVHDTGTDLHDHGDSAGAFTVVSGELEEVRPKADGSLITTRLSAGAVRTIAPGAVHDVRSPSALPAVSIHAYSPPLRTMTFYEAGTGGPRATRTVSTQSEGDLV
jgi:mannose-6-phosphate isomerase-like protein (cupin superfamily)